MTRSKLGICGSYRSQPSGETAFGGVMRCSLCEKNECLSGVICPACEAHYASLREGQLRRQSLQLGEHTVPHLAWSAAATVPGKGKARDESRSFLSFFKARKTEAIQAAPEELPPPPDWKNRVKPAPDGLPPLSEPLLESSPHPTTDAPQPEENIQADGTGQPLVAIEQGDASAPIGAESQISLELEANAVHTPEQPWPGPSLPVEVGEPETPAALTSFFETLSQAAQPKQANPENNLPEEKTTVEAQDAVADFLASLAQEPTAIGLNADAPEKALGQADGPTPEPFEAFPSRPDLPTPSIETVAEPQLSAPPPPAAVDPVDPAVFQNAWLPALDWSDQKEHAEPNEQGISPNNEEWDQSPSALPHDESAWAPGSWLDESIHSHQEADNPPGMITEPASPQDPASPSWDDFLSKAPTQDTPQAAAFSQSTTSEAPKDDPLAGFFADLQAAEAAPPNETSAENQSLSWKLDQAFAAMAAPPSFQIDASTPASVAPKAETAPREGRGTGPFSIDLGPSSQPQAPQPPQPSPAGRPKAADPSDGAFTFIHEEDEDVPLELGNHQGRSALKKPSPTTPKSSFGYTIQHHDDDEDEGRTIEL